MQYRENSYTVPLVKKNKLAGLLLRYDSRSQLLDAIPGPVITHFLKDAESQNYRGFPSAGFSFFPTRDPALREFAGEKGKNAGGVYVTNVEPGTPAMKAGLQVGDMVTAVLGGHVIYHRAPGGSVLQERGDVLEEYAFGREVLDISNLCRERGDVHDGERSYPLVRFDATRKAPSQLRRECGRRDGGDR